MGIIRIFHAWQDRRDEARTMVLMNGISAGKTSKRTGYRAGVIMVAVTAAVCIAALLFRTPLRSRLWAWQVVHGAGVADRAAPLTHLCNAGDGGRWGTETLLDDPDAEIRQCGIVVLQHVRSRWSRDRLVDLLGDPNRSVAEMAALGLAIHGDSAVIPELERMYRQGDARSASVACLALERLGVPDAVSTLVRLAGCPADVDRTAALVDSLAEIGTRSAARGLLSLLEDPRPCDLPTRGDRLEETFARIVERVVPSNTPVSAPATRPRRESSHATIGERAAAALARVSGLSPPFSSQMSKDRRSEARRVWRQWVESGGP